MGVPRLFPAAAAQTRGLAASSPAGRYRRRRWALRATGGDPSPRQRQALILPAAGGSCRPGGWRLLLHLPPASPASAAAAPALQPVGWAACPRWPQRRPGGRPRRHSDTPREPEAAPRGRSGQPPAQRGLCGRERRTPGGGGTGRRRRRHPAVSQRRYRRAAARSTAAVRLQYRGPVAGRRPGPQKELRLPACTWEARARRGRPEVA